jgi:hypothetical protein
MAAPFLALAICEPLLRHMCKEAHRNSRWRERRFHKKEISGIFLIDYIPYAG